MVQGNVSHVPSAKVAHDGVDANARRRIAPLMMLSSDSQAENYCVRFSPDDQYLASSAGNGLIHIYNVSTSKRAFELGHQNGAPTTQLRWRPHEALAKTKNVLVAAAANGVLRHWHVTSGKLLHEIKCEDENFFCLDFTRTGDRFAAAGKARVVRVYDETSKKLICDMSGGDSTDKPGHSNRIFSLKWHPTIENCIVTGGWDNTIQIWDIRVGNSVRSIFGPHICGDSMDISIDGKEMLTGSWRQEKQLQTYDFGTGKLKHTINWRGQNTIVGTDPCQLYAAQFSKTDSSLVAAGGSGANEAKVFERTPEGSPEPFTAIGTIRGLSRACYSVDFSHNDSKVAVCGGDGGVRVMKIHDN